MRVKLSALILCAAVVACADTPTGAPSAGRSLSLAAPDFDSPIGAMATGEHNSAGVAKSFLCGVIFSLTTDSHETISNSGNQSLWCKGTHPFTLDKTVIFRGFGCSFFFGGFTFDTKLVVNPAGAAILTCKSNPSS